MSTLVTGRTACAILFRTFEECVATVSWLVETPTRRILFYIGRNRSTTVSFRAAIGVATDGGSGGGDFTRPFLGPVLDRGPGDPYFVTAPCVLVEGETRSEEHTSELQSLMRISYAVFCLKKKNSATNQRVHRAITSQTNHANQ